MDSTDDCLLPEEGESMGPVPRDGPRFMTPCGGRMRAALPSSSIETAESSPGGRHASRLGDCSLWREWNERDVGGGSASGTS